MSMLGLLSVLFCALVAGVRYWDGSYFPDSGYKGTADVKSDHQNLSVADLVKLTECRVLFCGGIVRIRAPTHQHTHRQTITDKHISIWSHYRNVKSNNKNTDTDSNKAIAAATTISAKQHNKPHETTTAITPTTAISSQQPTAKNMRKIISLASSQPSSVDHLNPALKCMSSNLTCPGLSWDDTQLNGSSS